jgi:hypothetical protein
MKGDIIKRILVELCCVMASHTPNNHHPQENPTYKCDLGEIDGDRPRILNKKIAGPNIGGGNPTVYMGDEGGKVQY